VTYSLTSILLSLFSSTRYQHISRELICLLGSTVAVSLITFPKLITWNGYNIEKIEAFNFADKESNLKYLDFNSKVEFKTGTKSEFVRHSTNTTCKLRAPSSEGLCVFRGIVFQASFPGSGSEMNRMLVGAVSGVRSASQYKDKISPIAGRYKSEEQLYNFLIVKTHWPSLGAKPIESFNRAIVLIRDPLDAMPSYINWMYENQERKEDNHSIQAPVEVSF